ncbi:hypothetical protein TNCT_55791 [Trichonephila clavata]|uniref:Uncharacterized protein n=1 Tax=Trichonephila clavata TaxID=2740835 RepID=A0A8X6KZ34_TRICU|nr:hypothetical protein TNCT_55791 [Trichonephila clavata]
MNWGYSKGFGEGINSSRFMQDRAQPHRTAALFDVINKYFHYRIIALDYQMHSHRSLEWSPYSPLIFFLLGYVKHQIYRYKSQTIAKLEQCFSNVCQTVSTGVCKSFLQTATFFDYSDNIVFPKSEDPSLDELCS